MNRLLLVSIITVATIFSYQQISQAVCTEGPPNNWTCTTAEPNPDPSGIVVPTVDPGLTVNMLPGSAIDTIPENGGNGGSAIDTTDNNDQITLTDASVKTNQGGIRSQNGMDIINVTDSDITSRDECIDKGAVGDSVTNITGSTMISSRNDVFEGGSGSDVMFISFSTLTAQTEEPGLHVIQLEGGNDELTLGSGVALNGNFERIDCGFGFDTIVFAMDVPEDLLNRLSLEILRADPAGDTIVINGLTYTWERCELLVNELVGVPIEPRPIPTLSQWGIIAMAGLIGIVGFIAIRKKYEAA